MTPAEKIFFWTAVGFYVCSSLLYCAGYVFNKPRWPARATLAALFGFAAHTAAIAARWAATGHPPVMRNYENAVAGAWVVIAAFLLLAWRFRRLEAAGISTVPIALLMMGYGVMNNPVLEPFSVTTNSGWLYVHVIFAWFAYMSFVIAFGAAVMFLMKDGGRKSAFLERLPAPETLDELAYRLIAFGFIMDTVMIAAGSIWASKLWGSYWSWDPVETWSLISWLIYALYLHLRITFKWRGRRMAWFAVAALTGVIFCFWGVNYLQASLHIFNTQ